MNVSEKNFVEDSQLYENGHGDGESGIEVQLDEKSKTIVID